MQLRVVISSAVSSSSPGPGYHQQWAWAGDTGDTGTLVILTSCKSFHLFKSFFSESIDPLLQIIDNIDNTQNTIRIQLHFTKSTCPVSSSTQQPARSWPPQFCIYQDISKNFLFKHFNCNSESEIMQGYVKRPCPSLLVWRWYPVVQDWCWVCLPKKPNC